MRLGRLIWRIVVISIQRELAHRANLGFQALRMVVELIVGILTLELVFSRTTTLAGWGPAQALVVLGFFTCMSGVLQAFVEPNLVFFSVRVVRSGLLDEVLLRPVPSVVMTSLGSCQPWALVQVGLGIGVIVTGLVRAGSTPNALAIGVGVVVVIAGIATMWATRLLVAAFAFWSPHGDPSVLYEAAWQLGRYPAGIYPAALRLILTTVVPIAFLTTVPARILLGHEGSSVGALLGGLAVSVVAVLVAIRVWERGLRRYTSATS